MTIFHTVRDRIGKNNPSFLQYICKGPFTIHMYLGPRCLNINIISNQQSAHWKSCASITGKKRTKQQQRKKNERTWPHTTGAHIFAYQQMSVLIKINDNVNK